MHANIQIGDKVFQIKNDEFFSLVYSEDSVWSTDFELPVTPETVRLLEINNIYDRSDAVEKEIILNVCSLYYTGYIFPETINIEKNTITCWIKVNNTFRLFDLYTYWSMFDPYLEGEGDAYDKINNGQMMPICSGMVEPTGEQVEPYIYYRDIGNVYDILTSAGYTVSGNNIDVLKKYHARSYGLWLDTTVNMEKVIFGERYDSYLSISRSVSGVCASFSGEKTKVTTQILENYPTAVGVKPARTRCEKKFHIDKNTLSFKIYYYSSVPNMDISGQYTPDDYTVAARNYYITMAAFESFRVNEVSFNPNIVRIVSDKPFDVNSHTYHATYSDTLKIYYYNVDARNGRTYYNGTITDAAQETAVLNGFGNESFTVEPMGGGQQDFTIICDYFSPDFTHQPFLTYLSIFTIHRGRHKNVEYPSGDISIGTNGNSSSPLREITTDITGYTTRCDRWYDRYSTYYGGYGYNGHFRFSDCPNFNPSSLSDYREIEYMDIRGLFATTDTAQLGNITGRSLLLELWRCTGIPYTISDDVREIVMSLQQRDLLNVRPETSTSITVFNELKTMNKWNGISYIYPHGDENDDEKDINTVDTKTILLNKNTEMFLYTTIDNFVVMKPYTVTGVLGCVYQREIDSSETGSGIVFFEFDQEVEFPLSVWTHVSSFVDGWIDGNYTEIQFKTTELFDINSDISLNGYPVKIREKEFSDGAFTYTGIVYKNK